MITNRQKAELSRDGAIVLISPLAHRPGHFAANTLAWGIALRRTGEHAVLVASGVPDPKGISLPDVPAYLLPRPAGWLLRAMGRRSENPSRGERALATVLTLALASRVVKRRVRSVKAVQVSDGSHLPLFLWASRITRTVVVYRAFGGPDPRLADGRSAVSRAWQRLLRERRLRVVVETEEIGDLWRSVTDAPVFVVPYAVEAAPRDTAEPSEQRRRLGLPADRPCFLSFGPTRRTKRLDLLLAAANSLSFPVTVLHVGKVLTAPHPLEIAKRIGFTNLVVVDRFVSEQEAADYFKASDAVVLPYLPPHDRGSGVLLEACRWGRPVIATAVGYLGRFVREFGCGLVFDHRDPAALVRAMTDILERARWEECVMGARRAAEHHSWKMVMPRYLAILDEEAL